MNKKYLWFLGLSLVLGFIFYSLLYSSFTTDIKFSLSGGAKVEEKADSNMPATLPKVIQNRLAYQNYSKIDFIFGAIYTFNLQIDQDIIEVNKIPSFEFALTLPGKVIKTNANKIEGNQIIWQEFPQDNFFAQSYFIRWWLVILIILGLGYLIFRLIKKSKEGQTFNLQI